MMAWFFRTIDCNESTSPTSAFDSAEALLSILPPSGAKHTSFQAPLPVRCLHVSREQWPLWTRRDLSTWGERAWRAERALCLSVRAAFGKANRQPPRPRMCPCDTFTPVTPSQGVYQPPSYASPQQRSSALCPTSSRVLRLCSGR